ncbi:DUF1643 domain-containing protein [Bacillus paranthracis]
MKSEFAYFGHFYELFLGNYTVRCRSVLEIVRVKEGVNQESAVDAVVIMMNPGSSEPSNEGNPVERIDIENFVMDFNSRKLVRTIPDLTQSRITKIMDYKNWNHVRVLNLSDIREKKSGELSKKIREFEKKNLSMVHSIFSPQRKKERFNLISREVPVIVAWGGIPCTHKYMERCLVELESRQIKVFGIFSNEEKRYYHHPLTTKLSWCSKMKELLK